jgi:hypothetical protein
VRTKIDRAIKHRADLQQAVAEFVGSDFFEIKTEVDYKRRVVGRAVNVKRPGEKIGSLIGECALCLRSALDQLAFQLAKSHSGPLSDRVARSSAFPIFETGPLFRGEKGRGTAHKMAGMAPSTKRIIEEAQPYHRRRQPLLQALWQLEELANLDKHRETPLTGAIPAQGSVSIKFNNPGVTAFGFRPIPGPIEERRRVVYVLGENIKKADDLTVDLDVKASIAFDRKEGHACVRGWPLPAVIDGIFGVLALLVLPALGQEMHERFGEVAGIKIEAPEGGEVLSGPASISP